MPRFLRARSRSHFLLILACCWGSFGLVLGFAPQSSTTSFLTSTTTTTPTATSSSRTTPPSTTTRRRPITTTITSTTTTSSTTSTTTTQLHNSLLSGVDAFFINSPYTAAAIVCGVKASAADGVAQFLEWKDKVLKKNKQETADDGVDDDTDDDAVTSLSSDTSSSSSSNAAIKANLKRNVAFITYGALYQGMTQEFIFNHLYPIWFGTGTDWATVLIKVAFSLLVQTTLLTLPSLYIIKAAIERTPWPQAWQKYIDDIRQQQLLQKFYSLWGPVFTITFAFVPEQWRVTFIAVVSFFWLIILSGISSYNEDMTAAEKDRLCAIGQDFCEFDYDA